MTISLKRKKWVVIALAAICIFLALWWLKNIFSSSSETKYMTAAVRKGDIEVSVLTTGIVKPHRLVAVGARATGRIISMKVKPGDKVKEGDLLAEVDPTTQKNDLKSREAALTNMRAQLSQQEAQLTLAQKTFNRQKAMVASNAVSRADYDDADTQVKIHEAQIESLKAQIIQAEVDVETARVNLGYTQVIAPSDGTVLATVVQEGQNVNAVQSAPTIVILGDLSIMTVRTEISEADIVRVKPGQELYFNVIGNPDRRYEGKLEFIEPAPESIRSDISFNSASTSSSTTSAIYYNGIFNIDNADGNLWTYMTAEVHIVLGKAQKALLIPADAIQKTVSENKAIVQVIKDGKMTDRTIETGLNDKVMVEVKSGLEENETVITGSSTNPAAPGNPGRQRRMGPF